MQTVLHNLPWLSSLLVQQWTGNRKVEVVRVVTQNQLELRRNSLRFYAFFCNFFTETRNSSYVLNSLCIVSVIAIINLSSRRCFEKPSEFIFSKFFFVSNKVLYSTPSANDIFSTISKDGVLLPDSICVIYGAETPIFSARSS